MRTLALLAATVLLCIVTPASEAHAQTFSDAELGAINLFEDAADAFLARAYDPLTRKEIYQRSLDGVIKKLGQRFEKFAIDLKALPDAEARNEFFWHLQDIANAPGQRLDMRKLAEIGIRATCKSIDPYTRYISADDLSVHQRASTEAKSGIGVTIYDEGDGRFAGYPVQNSAAEAAGFKPGDEILSVDGRLIKDETLETIASWIRGAPGTEVVLQLKRNFGRTERVAIRREAIDIPPVSVKERFGRYTIHVRKFSPDLPDKLAEILREIKPGPLLTIDLRGNSGGDIASALKAADLFLGPDQLVTTVKERVGPEVVFKTSTPKQFEVPTLAIQQDGGTASAAEIFISCLVLNDGIRAISQGQKTYGKGRVQQRIPLNAGGILQVSVGEYLAPNGQSVEGIGLLPSALNDGRIFAEEGKDSDDGKLSDDDEQAPDAKPE